MIQTDKLWSEIVHYYIDKKGYSKEDANKIAQRIITREKNRKICNNDSCRHLVDEHINRISNYVKNIITFLPVRLFPTIQVHFSMFSCIRKLNII